MARLSAGLTDFLRLEGSVQAGLPFWNESEITHLEVNESNALSEKILNKII